MADCTCNNFPAGLGTVTFDGGTTFANEVDINSGQADGTRLAWFGGTNGSQQWRARVGANGALEFFPGEGQPVLLGLQTGNVFHVAGRLGVNTTTPSFELDVNGYLAVNNGQTDGARMVWRGGTGGTQEYRARVGTTGNLEFFPGEGQPALLLLTQSGQLGIAMAPQYPLDVNGTVRANGLLIGTVLFGGSINNSGNRVLMDQNGSYYAS